MNKKHVLLFAIIAMALFCFAQESAMPSYLLAQNGTEESVEIPKVTKLSYNQSYTKGFNDATMMHSSSGYMLGGVASGLLLGLIGTVIIGVAAGGSTPSYIPEEVDPSGYQAGYFKKAKSKNQGAAWGGGLLGTAIVVGLVLAANSGS